MGYQRPSRQKDRCKTCGQKLSRRTDESHNLLFAITQELVKHWPHDHRFQPEGGNLKQQAEHLRGWLLVEAGHVKTCDIDQPEAMVVPIVKSMRDFLMGTTHYVRMVRTPDGIRIIGPASINKDDVKAKEFNDIAQRYYDVIEHETGIPVDSLKRQSQHDGP